MLFTRLLVLFGATSVFAAPDVIWARVLRNYSRGNVTIYRHANRSWNHANGTALRPDKIVEDRMPTVKLLTLPEPLICRGILYTSHDASRSADYALDRVKAEWALSQGACFLRLNIDIPTSISGASAPPDVVRAWRRRTPNNPIVLVDRYKGGLVLTAMVKTNLIKHPKSSEKRRVEPWIFYADGDVGLTNMKKTFESFVAEVLKASRQPTLEERTLAEHISALTNVTIGANPRNITSLPSSLRSMAQKVISDTKFVGNMQAPPEDRHLYMLFPHGDCMLPRSFVQTGTILYKPSRLSAYVLEVLANSAYQIIDTGSFAMGDQAIMDWLLTRSFGVRWWAHTSEHCRNSNFHHACNERTEVTYISQIVKPFISVGQRYYMMRPDFRLLSSVSNFTQRTASDDTRMSFAGLSAGFHGLLEPPFERRLRSVGDKNGTSLRKLRAEDDTLLPNDANPIGDWLDESEEYDSWWAQNSGAAPALDFSSEQLYESLEPAQSSVKLLNQRYLERYWNYWQPETDGSVAFTCSRWNNSPICANRRRRGADSPFPYRCGDLLFHLYGCSKNELYSAGLRDLLQTDRACDDILPETLKQIINLD